MALTSADVDRILKEGQAQAGKNPWRPSRPYDIGLKAENLHNAGFPGMGIPEQKLGNWWWTDRNKTQFAYWGQTKDGDWTQHHDTTEPLYGPSWQASAALQAPRLQEQIEREAAAPPGTPPVVDAEVPDPERTPSDVGVVSDPQDIGRGLTYADAQRMQDVKAEQAKIKYREIPEGFVRPGARNGGSGPGAVNGGAPNGGAGGNGVTTTVSPAEQSALDWAAGLDPTNAPGGTRSAAELSALDWARGLGTTPGGRSTLLSPGFDIGGGGYPGGIQRVPPSGGQVVRTAPVLGGGGYPGGMQRTPPTGGQVVRTGLPVFRGGGGYPGGIQRTPPTGGQVTGLRSAAALGGGYPGGILRGPPYQGRAVQLSQAIGGGGYPGGMLRNPPYQGQPVGLPTAADMPYTVQQALNNAISRDPYGIRAAMSAGPTVPWGASGGGYPGQNPWQQSGGRPVGVNQYAALNTPYTVQGALNNAYSRDPYGIRAAWTGQQAGGPVRGYTTPQFSPSGPQWQW